MKRKVEHHPYSRRERALRREVEALTKAHNGQMTVENDLAAEVARLRRQFELRREEIGANREGAERSWRIVAYVRKVLEALTCSEYGTPEQDRAVVRLLLHVLGQLRLGALEIRGEGSEYIRIAGEAGKAETPTRLPHTQVEAAAPLLVNEKVAARMRALD